MTNDGRSEPLGTKLQQGGRGGTGNPFRQADREDDNSFEDSAEYVYCVD